MRCVAPRTGAPEVMVAENQEEYLTVTVAIHHNPDGAGRYLLTRWTFTPEERDRIAKGEDLYVAQLNFGSPMTPINACVGPGWWAEDGKRYIQDGP